MPRHWGQPLLAPYMRECSYKGTKVRTSTFYHHQCTNSGFIAKGVGSIVRILPHTVMNIVPCKTWKVPIIAYFKVLTWQLPCLAEGKHENLLV